VRRVVVLTICMGLAGFFGGDAPPEAKRVQLSAPTLVPGTTWSFDVTTSTEVAVEQGEDRASFGTQTARVLRLTLWNTTLWPDRALVQASEYANATAQDGDHYALAVDAGMGLQRPVHIEAPPWEEIDIDPEVLQPMPLLWFPASTGSIHRNQVWYDGIRFDVVTEVGKADAKQTAMGLMKGVLVTSTYDGRLQGEAREAAMAADSWGGGNYTTYERSERYVAKGLYSVEHGVFVWMAVSGGGEHVRIGTHDAEAFDQRYSYSLEHSRAITAVEAGDGVQRLPWDILDASDLSKPPKFSYVGIRDDQFGAYNAAEPAARTYFLYTHGPEQDQSNWTHAWTILDYGGAVLATSSNDHISHTFTQPGAFLVSVRISEGNKTLYQRSVTERVQYNTAMTVECEAVTDDGNGQGGCPAVEFPVPRQAWAVDVDARYIAIHAPVSTRLVVLDGLGQERPAAQQTSTQWRGNYLPSGHEKAPGTWHAHMEVGPTIMGSITFTISVHIAYTPASPAWAEYL
jgi:hypothetical protein